MSKKNKKKKTAEFSTNGNGEGKVRPVLTGMLVASILIVATISIIDGNNVYSEYCRQHENVPGVLACVDALSEGIYPWSQITAYAAVEQGYVDSGPGVVPKTEDVEAEIAEETETQAAGQETEPETKADPQPKVQPVTESQVNKDAQATAAESAATPTVATPGALADNGQTRNFTKVDYSWFGDAAFVGDSFTQGLMLYADIPGADCLCYQSKNTRNIMDSEIHLKSGKTSTVRNELSKKQYGKVYIMLGINELSKDAAGFAQRYQKVINEIRALQPNAIIYVQSILHTTPNKSAKTNFKNEIVDMNNEALKGLADNKTIFYVDVNPPFDDGTGALRADYSGDGVHLKASHYKEWRDYLLNFGVK